jgi:hypothetical protein
MPHFSEEKITVDGLCIVIEEHAQQCYLYGQIRKQNHEYSFPYIRQTIRDTQQTMTVRLNTASILNKFISCMDVKLIDIANLRRTELEVRIETYLDELELKNNPAPHVARSEQALIFKAYVEWLEEQRPNREGKNLKHNHIVAMNQLGLVQVPQNTFNRAGRLFRDFFDFSG